MQASVREVKRLDSISRSPVYSSIGEALAGLPTIRAFRCEQRLSLRNADLVDASVIMSLVNMSMNRCEPCSPRPDPPSFCAARMWPACHATMICCSCCIKKDQHGVGMCQTHTTACCGRASWNLE